MNRTVLIGVAGAVIVLLALLLNDVLNETPPEQADPAEATGESVAEGPSDGGAADGGAADAATRDESTARAPETSSAEDAAQDAAGEAAGAIDRAAETAEQLAAPPDDAGADAETGPSFDVVRISKDGDTVIAGRAPPGSEVTILDGGEPIGTVTADGRGEWVYLPSEPLAPGSHDLSLQAVTPTGETLESDSKVVLVVPERGKDIAGRPTAQPQEPLAMLVPKDGGEVGARVLQKPSVPGSVESEAGDLALDSVDYDEAGEVSLGGRGLPGTEVRAYLNNDLIGRAEVPPTGLWRITPDGAVEPGGYQLRLDMVREGGAVVSRIELPFSRAEPMRDFDGGAFVVVQPGNSLWRIARRTLDSGFNYTVIYEANKEQIRDPDLIYPGQIFEVPAN
ncbi:MAG: LysM peptidoglycan-binding domain-containing protein [Marivibrio sp.]|uniref:LysM peptidoglycan-binding domain-containing protein n=1 Tax=Marivibrio sp. TaxID=2039719 RepID=UPI0032EBF853